MTQALLTVAEVAENLRVNTDTVYRLIRHDNLPAIKVGRQWRFVTVDIDRWMRDRAQGTPQSRQF